MLAFAKKRSFIVFLLFLSSECALPLLSQERPPSIELTSANLSEYLSRLRANDGRPGNYVVTEPLRLSGSQEEWRVNNLTFAQSGEITLESTNLTIDVKGIITTTNKEKVIFRSF